MIRPFVIAAISLVFGAMASSAQSNDSIPVKAFAAFDESGEFHPYSFNRRPVGDNDIQIEIMYAGICHSDLHNVYADWGKQEYPMVPGHEIAGKVVKIGKNVTKFKVGDYAGIGCLVNSCHECDECKTGHENYCSKRVSTYHGIDRYNNDEPTQGGYSNNYVVAEDFAIKIPDTARLDRVAPLLCAGITTYSPIKFAGIKKGDKVAVAGFGGLGHMAVKYLKQLGADVSVFDITDEKRLKAEEMGVTNYYNVTNPEDFSGHKNTFDFIISTIPANYDPMSYMKMLKYGGKMCIVGLPATKDTPQIPLSAFVRTPNRMLFGSVIGGIPETQEMLDYSVVNDIYPDVEIIPADAQAITEAYSKVKDGKVKFRYVIDMTTLK